MSVEFSRLGIRGGDGRGLASGRRAARLALLAVAISVALDAAAFGSAHRLTALPAARGAAGARVMPSDPFSLAAGANGVLYIGDPGRHQILKRLPGGRFEVAVGTGVAGTSGDGGPAARAEIDIPQSLLATPAGALYIFDGRDTPSTPSGFTAEVREVAPDGTITTLVGACTGIDASHDAVARAALGTPSGAIGPNGNLYLLGSTCGERASGPLLELTSAGRLVDDAPFDAALTKASCLPPSGIAFSGNAALYAACDSGGGHGKELLIVQPNGSAKAFPHVYPYDDEGGLATAPDGTVIAGDYYSVVRVTPQGVRTIINFTPGASGSRALGPNGSMEPNGIAIDRDGNIYLAATSGFGNGTFTGIIELHTSGRVQVLWSRPSTRAG